MSNTILTFAEIRGGALRRPSLEAVSEARRLADALSGRVVSVLVGEANDAATATLASHGADKVICFSAEALSSYSSESYARAVAKAEDQRTAKTMPEPSTVHFTYGLPAGAMFARISMATRSSVPSSFVIATPVSFSRS